MHLLSVFDCVVMLCVTVSKDATAVVYIVDQSAIETLANKLTEVVVDEDWVF